MKAPHWTSHLFKKSRIRFWLMLGGAIAGLMGFEEVADDVFNDPLEGDFEAFELDRLIAAKASQWRNLQLTQVMTDLTALGSVSVLATLFILLASVLATYRDFRGLSFLSVVLVGAGLWPYTLKAHYARTRPPEIDRLAQVTDLSFPSGHSFAASALYIGLAYYSAQYARTWRHEVFFYSLGALLILTVGVSRVYLGVHYPTDVMAGLCGGIAWGLLSACVYEYLVPMQRRLLK